MRLISTALHHVIDAPSCFPFPGTLSTPSLAESGEERYQISIGSFAYHRTIKRAEKYGVYYRQNSVRKVYIAVVGRRVSHCSISLDMHNKYTREEEMQSETNFIPQA